VPVPTKAEAIKGDLWRSSFDRKRSRGQRKSLCLILCPTVPKIVPFPRTAADHLMALGWTFPLCPNSFVNFWYQGIYRLVSTLSSWNPLRNRQVVGSGPTGGTIPTPGSADCASIGMESRCVWLTDRRALLSFS
jgi:hypothetical protein